MFDRFLIVDWSAANSPKTGADSIWIADARGAEPVDLRNPATREEATDRIADVIAEALMAGERLFVGFDFAFGYPQDAAPLPGEGYWQSVWEHLRWAIRDDARNVSNRFEVASDLNERWGGRGPFWGYPHRHHGRYGALPFRRPDYEVLGVRERRAVDKAAGAASPPWKLTGAGAVGSQSLVGIARLQALRERFGEALAVWPFETGFADRLETSVVVAEIYPSLWPTDRSLHPIKDACQVGTLASAFAGRDANGAFAALLDGPRQAAAGIREAAMSHEAWIVGYADGPIPL